MKIATRSEVDPFIVMDIMANAIAAEDAGLPIWHLEVGQPSTAAPRRAREAVSAALLSGEPMGYTSGLGLMALRKRIAKLYQEWYQLEISHERIIITNGSSGAFLLAFASLFDMGDRVGIAEPGYPSYRNILKALGIQAVGLPAGPKTRYQPNAQQLREAQLDGVLIASPGNPTGTILSHAELSEMIEAMNGRAFISDEIYHGLHYGKPAVSALELTDDVYVINSFSKYFSMTGWRVGWMVVPETHIRTVERLAQNMFICAPHCAQLAALHAMDAQEELEAYRVDYANARQILIDRLPQMGLTEFAPPDGAFYVYINIAHLGINSFDLAQDILAQTGVALTPGHDFDPEHGSDFIRISYARGAAHVTEALDRLAPYFASLSLSHPAHQAAQ